MATKADHDRIDAVRRELAIAKADLATAVQWAPQWKVKQHRLYVQKLELELMDYTNIERESDGPTQRT
jgi:hypothetical protein